MDALAVLALSPLPSICAGLRERLLRFTFLGERWDGWLVALIVAFIAAVILEVATKMIRTFLLRLPRAFLYVAVRPQLTRKAWRELRTDWWNELDKCLIPGPAPRRRYASSLVFALRLAVRGALRQAAVAGLPRRLGRFRR